MKPYYRTLFQFSATPISLEDETSSLYSYLTHTIYLKLLLDFTGWSRIRIYILRLYH